jgi:hypothetical protein
LNNVNVKLVLRTLYQKMFQVGTAISAWFFFIIFTIMNPLAMRREEKTLSEKEEGSSNRSIYFHFSPHTNLTSYFDPKQGPGVELAL